MDQTNQDHHHQYFPQHYHHDDHILSPQTSLQSLPSLTSSPNSTPNHRFSLLNTFPPLSASVSSIAVVGDTVFTGSSDREIRSLSNSNNNGNAANFTFTAGNGAVKSLVVSGDRLFSAHQDHKIRVWKISSSHNVHNNNNNKCYARVATLPTLGDRATRMIMPGNRVTVRRHKTSTWVHHVDAVSSLVLSPDKSLLYSVSWDRSLKIWRVSDFRCMESVLDAHDDAINALVASPDGHVYTGSADKKIKVWLCKDVPRDNSKSTTTAGTALVGCLEKHKSGVNALAISEDGSILYSGASDRSVVVWERVKDYCGGSSQEGFNMVVLGALRGHTKAILCLAVVKDLVISGSADKTVRVWRGVERSYSCVGVFHGHTGPVKCLTAVIDHHGNNNNNNKIDDDDEESYLIYSGGLDCEVKVWQIIVPNLF